MPKIATKKSSKTKATTKTSKLIPPLRREETIKEFQSKIFYIKLKTGEELISLVGTVGERLAQIRMDVLREPNIALRAEFLADLADLDAEERSMIDLSPGMIELHYPTRIIFLPSPKGVPSLILTPWVPTAITSKQTFRISMDSIQTMAVPDAGIMIYYNTVIKKILLMIAFFTQAKGDIDPNSVLGLQLNELKKTIQEEQENSEDDEIAKLLAKSRVATKEISDKIESVPHATNSPSISSGNNVPTIYFNAEKKTLH